VRELASGIALHSVLSAALLYELPANGLLRKRPSLLLGGELQNASELLHGPPFDLVYASAVFLHMPDATVWKSVSALAVRLAAPHGRLFVSHNIKFCTRLSWTECEARLRKAGLSYVEVSGSSHEVSKELQSDKIIRTCQTKTKIVHTYPELVDAQNSFQLSSK
jgi:hypothetical protein